MRICTHYFAHGAWLEEARCSATPVGSRHPGVLVHGRLDISAPVETAWQLARAWPDAELHVVEDAGHQATGESRTRLLEALDAFAQR